MKPLASLIAGTAMILLLPGCHAQSSVVTREMSEARILSILDREVAGQATDADRLEILCAGIDWESISGRWPKFFGRPVLPWNASSRTVEIPLANRSASIYPFFPITHVAVVRFEHDGVSAVVKKPFYMPVLGTAECIDPDLPEHVPDPWTSAIYRPDSEEHTLFLKTSSESLVEIAALGGGGKRIVRLTMIAPEEMGDRLIEFTVDPPIEFRVENREGPIPCNPALAGSMYRSDNSHRIETVPSSVAIYRADIVMPPHEGVTIHVASVDPTEVAP